MLGSIPDRCSAETNADDKYSDSTNDSIRLSEPSGWDGWHNQVVLVQDCAGRDMDGDPDKDREVPRTLADEYADPRGRTLHPRSLPPASSGQQ